MKTCSGFEDQSNVSGTNNYICTPHGGSYWDDCWKCPPKVLLDTCSSMQQKQWSTFGITTLLHHFYRLVGHASMLTVYTIYSKDNDNDSRKRLLGNHHGLET